MAVPVEGPWRRVEVVEVRGWLGLGGCKVKGRFIQQSSRGTMA